MKKFIETIFRSEKKIPFEGKAELIERFISSGKVPWTEGYNEYRFDIISCALADYSTLNFFIKKELPDGFAKGIDERAVEYPWIFARLSGNKAKLLDAGSTFNFPAIIEATQLKNKELTIATYFPESYKFNEKRVSYVYADLRELPFRDEWFDEIVCQSTIEHIGMDNSIYGYKQNYIETNEKNYDYIYAVEELLRVLKRGGHLMITFPFGKFENHGFFQQFDSEMLDRVIRLLNKYGKTEMDFLKYTPDGWIFSDEQGTSLCESYNPHSGKGKGTDGAAHCRGICCINFGKAA